ncbi:VOC family protein [Hymenobacter lutimineralis]|uniref:VOC family protein n=1 Tax=Hymenobacter lutimineralis TaxID=2606448 RepID=A0A5D6UVG0_9BACT|nr:VOC family protein [Hymenobacter lutimineralis]TYZ06662.1 VOC family protein [Hymenobacter lutimineralis]
MNLNQLTVPSRNLPAAVAFYQRLGLRLIVDALPRYARFECPEGDATFSLHQVEELPRGNGIWVYFECANLDEQVQLLRAAGVEFETLPTDQNWLWREARLQDPDGHQLIFYHAGENRKNPPWRVEGIINENP